MSVCSIFMSLAPDELCYLGMETTGIFLSFERWVLALLGQIHKFS